MRKYFSFINFGNPLYILARNGTPKEALTSHVGQQKFTWCLFKYMRMGKHPEPIEINFFFNSKFSKYFLDGYQVNANIILKKAFF